MLVLKIIDINKITDSDLYYFGRDCEVVSDYLSLSYRGVENNYRFVSLRYDGLFSQIEMLFYCLKISLANCYHNIYVSSFDVVGFRYFAKKNGGNIYTFDDGTGYINANSCYSFLKPHRLDRMISKLLRIPSRDRFYRWVKKYYTIYNSAFNVMPNVEKKYIKLICEDSVDVEISSLEKVYIFLGTIFNSDITISGYNKIISSYTTCDSTYYLLHPRSGMKEQEFWVGTNFVAASGFTAETIISEMLSDKKEVVLIGPVSSTFINIFHENLKKHVYLTRDFDGDNEFIDLLKRDNNVIIKRLYEL
jgi:hypothetical protein